MKKRKFVCLLGAGLLALAIPLSACGGGTELPYSTGINAETGLYDNELFYRNDLQFTDAPDPGAIYEDGYFYTVVTGAMGIYGVCLYPFGRRMVLRKLLGARNY